MNDSPEIGLTINAGGIETNYHDQGTGSPVVLLHGSGPGVSAFVNWRLLIPRLAEQHRVLAPDMVGFGFTDRPQGQQYTMETWLDHIIAFLDALELERVHVVGNSFGGPYRWPLPSPSPRGC